MSEHPCIIPDQSTQAPQAPAAAVKRGIWSAGERSTLDEGLKAGLTLEQIATGLGRSPFAVDCQLATVALAAIGKGTSLEDARATYKFSDEAMTTVKKSADRKAAKKTTEKAPKTTAPPEPELPFAIAPADRVAAYTAFYKSLAIKVDAMKQMGISNSDIENQITIQLAAVAASIDLLAKAS